MKVSKGVLGVALVLSSSLASSPASAADKKATVKIVNKSDWRLQEFYLSPADADDWGPDQLKEDVIESGEAFTLTSIPCDSWDVKLVDEDGDACVVEAVDICGGGGTWTITSKDLLKCQSHS